MLDEPTVDVVVADDGHEPEPGGIAQVMQAEYSRPYLAHASLGPSCAIAVAESDRYRVWTHSQGIFHLRQELAKVLSVEPGLIEVVHREGAGCYGANGADDAALDAVLLARVLPGQPVRVQWMRDDENAWEPYGTAMFVRLRAGIGSDGSIVQWGQDVWGNGHRDRPGPAGEIDAGARHSESAGSESTNLLAARHLEVPFEASTPAPPPSKSSGSGRNANPLYEFAARHVVNHYVARTPLRVSALRSLGAHANVFAIESFMDEVAHRIGVDPIAYRLRHLGDDRATEVIRRVAAMAGWEERTAGGEGIGLGIGFARYKNAGAYVAVIAEMEVDRDLHLRRVWAACDAGLVVNPDGLENQLEGGIIQAASWTLKEEVKFTPGEIISRGWNSYPILTFAEVPQVSVQLVVRPDIPPCGIGEAVAGPTSAAIANAIFAASGVRLRDMPLSRARFIQAASR
jgi:CO/xanthine dehydrogenase Mo-binding subunit